MKPTCQTIKLKEFLKLYIVLTTNYKKHFFLIALSEMITPHHDPYSTIFQPNRFRGFVNKYQSREWDKSVLTTAFQKNFPRSPGRYMRQSSLIIKLQVVEPQILRIKDSSLSVFLIILRVFKNKIFFLIIKISCFCKHHNTKKMHRHYLISCHCSLSKPPENIRKPLVFWCFPGV